MSGSSRGESAVVRRKRHLLVLENEQWRGASARWSELQEQLAPAVKSGYAAGRRDTMLNNFDYALIVVAVLAAAGAFTKYLNWAFVAYGGLALVSRTPSRRVLTAAALSLLLIPIGLALHRSLLADDFAVMTLYFLCIGLMRVLLERKWPVHRRSA